MIAMRRFTGLGTAALLGAGLLVPASADASMTRPGDPGGFFDAEAAVPFNGPDENGCVKICLQDISPCDPPVYKHADGRCSQRRRH